jgi:hypothetical protein
MITWIPSTSVLKRRLQPVADPVRLLHAHVAIDDQVKLDKRGPARHPGADIMGLDGAMGLGLDDVVNTMFIDRIDRLVHQPVDR